MSSHKGFTWVNEERETQVDQPQEVNSEEAQTPETDPSRREGTPALVQRPPL